MGVYTGCITDTWLFELLVKIDPGCGDLLTASQFLFTAFFSFFLNLEVCGVFVFLCVVGVGVGVSVGVFSVEIVLFLIKIYQSFPLSFSFLLPLEITQKFSPIHP